MMTCFFPVAWTAARKSALSQALISPGRLMMVALGYMSKISLGKGPLGPEQKMIFMRVPLMEMPNSLIPNFLLYAESESFAIGDCIHTYLFYTYSVRSTSGKGPKGICLRRSVSVSRSTEDPCGFCKRLIGNDVLNNSPDSCFTLDIATKERPGVKSTCPSSMTALSNVKP